MQFRVTISGSGVDEDDSWIVIALVFVIAGDLVVVDVVSLSLFTVIISLSLLISLPVSLSLNLFPSLSLSKSLSVSLSLFVCFSLDLCKHF